MKNLVLKVIVAIVIVTCSFNEAKAQASFLGNNSINQNHFVGWTNAVTFPLEIRHDGFRPILFETFTQERMRITEYGNVSIGNVNTVGPKLEVFLHTNNASFGMGAFESRAIQGVNRVGGLSDYNVGVFAVSEGGNYPETHENVGGAFRARNAWRNMAVDAEVSHASPGEATVGKLGWCIRAVARDHSSSNIGIVARAEYGAGSGAATELVGISAGIDGAIGNPTEWAGAFQGDVQIWGDAFSNQGLLTSDEQFKTNIQSIEDALGIIDQLAPKKYEFRVDEFGYLNFPEGERFGVIAQDLLGVVPELVEESRMLTKYDSLGNVTAEPIEFLAVNYDGLIPILIAGMKEQQSIIDAQNEALSNVMDQLDDLQQQINNCCVGGDSGYKNFSPGGDNGEQHMQKSSPNGNVLGQNSPNPFRSQTTISYTLEQGGEVLLNVYDRNGKVVANLEEAEQAADTYRYEWDASGLPAGLYHYALYVDGELLLKKAIKLND